MENCLVIQLKSVVDNNELVKLGSLRMHKSAGGLGYISILRSSNLEEMEATIIGDGYFTDSTGAENYGKTATATTASSYLIMYLSTGEFDIEITNKEKIKTISCRLQANLLPLVGFDVLNVKYNDLTKLDLSYSKIHGDIGNVAFPHAGEINAAGNDVIYGDLRPWLEALNGGATFLVWDNDGLYISGDAATLVSQNPNITQFKVGTEISGNFNLLGKCKLTQFKSEVRQPNLVGSIEEYVAQARTSFPGVSGNLQIFETRDLPNITYNSNPISQVGVSIRVTWDSSTMNVVSL